MTDVEELERRIECVAGAMGCTHPFSISQSELLELIERLRYLENLYGKAFITARELLDDDAYKMFVEMMDKAREALGRRR